MSIETITRCDVCEKIISNKDGLQCAYYELSVRPTFNGSAVPNVKERGICMCERCLGNFKELIKSGGWEKNTLEKQAEEREKE